MLTVFGCQALSSIHLQFLWTGGVTHLFKRSIEKVVPERIHDFQQYDLRSSQRIPGKKRLDNATWKWLYIFLSSNWPTKSREASGANIPNHKQCSTRIADSDYQ